MTVLAHFSFLLALISAAAGASAAALCPTVTHSFCFVLMMGGAKAIA
jgi:hypothetical protein